MIKHVYQIKLITGDDILTEVVDENHDKIIISNPFKIIKERVIVDSTPKEINYFSRWMEFASDTKFSINKYYIMISSIADDQVIAHYNTMINHIDNSDQSIDNTKLTYH